MLDATVAGGPIAKACHAFLNGDLDPNTPEGLRTLLCGEGEKRVEAFVFELLFDRVLSRFGFKTASRWMRGFLPRRSGYLWIVTENKNGLNECDNAFIGFLSKRKQKILLVRWSKKITPIACLRMGKEWGEYENLEVILTRIYGAPLPHKETDNVVTLKTLGKALSDLTSRIEYGEAIELAQQRVLINNFIRRWSRRQPIDIDAVILNHSGIIKVLEFKRKYPSRNMMLSLDTSHVESAEWFSDNGLCLTYVVLIDPRRNKNQSALELIKSYNRERAIWGSVDINNKVFSQQLKTTGKDSGMRGVSRVQQGIHIREFSMIGGGFTPHGLKPFIDGDRSMPVLTESHLSG
jgi:hypothetical protein